MQLQIHMSDLNPSQLELLRSTERNVAMLGGFGSGKTTAGALKLLHLRACNPGVPGGFFGPNWRTLMSVDWNAIKRVFRGLPREMRPKLVDKTGECWIDFRDGGAPIYMRSASIPESFDGLDLGFCVCDEARYYSTRNKNVIMGRVRVKCPLPQRVFVTTPAYGWLYDEFCGGKPHRKIIHAPTYENSHNLDSSFIDDLRLSYSARMQRAYIDGKFTVLEGAVFDAFDESSPDWIVDFDPHTHPMVDSKVYVAWDPGFRRSAVMWILEKRPGHWIVFDEIMPDAKSDTDVVAMVNKRGWPIDEIWIDAAAKATQSFEGSSTLKAIRTVKTRSQRPVRWLKGPNRDIPFGVDKLRTLLGGDGNPIRIQFASRLKDIERDLERGIIKDLASLPFPEHKDGRPIDDRPLKNGVSDHSTDALRYWAVGMWLTKPELRGLDPRLRAANSGFTVDRY